MQILWSYLAAISLVSLIVCGYDKWAATHAPKHRIREATLLLLSALGGGCAMLLGMLLVRHKTKHPKFMIGIPLIIVFQILCILAWNLLARGK